MSHSEEFAPQVPVLDLSEGTDLLMDFVAEAFEHLTTAEEAIMALESDPSNGELVDTIFRAFHTIKGVAGFLDFFDIKTLAHQAETVLDMVRKGQSSFEGAVTEAAFASIDGLRKLVTLLGEQVNNNGNLGSPYYDVTSIINQLKEIISGGTGTQAKPPIKKVGEILLEQEEVTDEELEKALVIQNSGNSNKKIGEILQDINAVSSKGVDKALRVQKGVTESSIKIRIDKLDSLIELVGELVISETQVVQNPKIRLIDDHRIVKDMSELDRITRQLQETAMGMRLVPVKPTFQKMLRIIRDLSKKINKDIEVRLEGEETEIDKNMVELISDPLVHMVRNAADHGIESKEVRAEKGKPSKGQITLSAFHKGGNVVVEIQDDGAGLNKEAILSKAIANGIIKEDEVLEDHRIYNLVFEPGFSTAAAVTDVSGRGVGMDVVKRNIEQLRGKIEITSEQDKGSVFSIQLPITLAIIEGIILMVNQEKYVLPINSIIEFVQPVHKFLKNIIGKGEVYSIHGTTYPLIRLYQHFGIDTSIEDFEKMTICLVESDYGRACVVVDQLLGQQQVVVKSLGDKLKETKGVSGGAILGDGRVGLILDVNDVMASSQQR